VTASSDPLEEQDPHFTNVARAFAEGKVVPFLGAGVNLFTRPAGTCWTRDQTDYLPSGSELAEYLADNFGLRVGDRRDLLRVAEFVALMSGSGSLYSELHRLFNADYPPNLLHNFLATLPGILRERGCPYPYQLIVTTNYDDVLERAFRDAGEPFDVASYVADGKHLGKFWHTRADGSVNLIDRPDEYLDLPLGKRTVIVKIHGAVDRSRKEEDSEESEDTDESGDSFVITEDDYIDYLARAGSSNPLPKSLVARMRVSHLLFLGYSLRDWNLRVILRRMWDERKRPRTAWAVQLNPEPIDLKFWSQQKVDIFNVPLEDYVARLSRQVNALARAKAAAT